MINSRNTKIENIKIFILMPNDVLYLNKIKQQRDSSGLFIALQNVQVKSSSTSNKMINLSLL